MANVVNVEYTPIGLVNLTPQSKEEFENDLELAIGTMLSKGECIPWHYVNAYNKIKADRNWENVVERFREACLNGN